MYDDEKRFFKFDVLVDSWHEAILMHPEWRRGQALFNMLDAYDHQLAEELRLSEYNPFYDDKNLRGALDFIMDRYS